MNAGRATRLTYIDGWRTLAVGLVILAHLGQNHEVRRSFPALHLADALEQYAQTGVHIFFFISGYVVARMCLAEIRARGDLSIGGFYVRRIFRIVPPLTIYLASCAALSLLGVIDLSPEAFLASLLYLCNNSLVACGWYGAHTWSLAFEEQFYLLFPMLLCLVELRRRPVPAAAVAALVLAAIPLVWPLNYVGRSGFLVIYGLFLAGYLAARGLDRVAQSLPYPGAILAVAALATFVPYDVLGRIFLDGSPDAKQVFTKYFKVVHVISIPLLVLLTGRTGTLLHTGLASALPAQIGRASYSIYLWQQLATSALFTQVTALQQLGALVAVVIGCLVLYEVVEKPLIAMGRRLSER